MEAQDFSASTSDASPHQPQIVKDNLSSRYCSSQNLPAVLNDPRLKKFCKLMYINKIRQSKGQ